jgi:hypothetical protein
MTAIWDKAFLKQHERNAREDALAVQSDEDWKSAELLLEREMSDVCDGFVDCPLPACRRARRCVGNRPICLPWCPVEFEPGGEQERFEQFYAEIQRERRDAAAEQREPCVERVMTDRVHVEDDEIENEPPAPRPSARLKETCEPPGKRCAATTRHRSRRRSSFGNRSRPPLRYRLLPSRSLRLKRLLLPPRPLRPPPRGSRRFRRRWKRGSTRFGPTMSPENRFPAPSRASLAVGRTSMEQAAVVEGPELTAH